MPVIGIGTGSYGKNSGKSNISYVEVWNYTDAYDVSQNWYKVGGTRWDSACDYVSVDGTAAGLLNATANWTLAKREDFFITSKTGPGRPLGYNDSITEWQQVVNMWNTTYVDLLLIHWPYQNISTSSDPVCNGTNTKYNIKLCIQQTWKAYEYIFKQLKVAKMENYDPCISRTPITVDHTTSATTTAVKPTTTDKATTTAMDQLVT
eukprot:99357_1